MKAWLKGAVIGAAASFAVTGANAATNLLFIVDASNSMWGQIAGTAKIETAKSTLDKLLTEIPVDSNVGLMAYGHRQKDDCKDVELMQPVGPIKLAALKKSLDSLTPTGKTPIANALQQSAAAFSEDTTQRSVVLISDGIETCDGDPCAVAETLAKSGVDVKVHVVGFDISEEDRAQLECIAEKGNGQYFAANSTEGFNDAVSQAVKVAQAEPAPEPEPEPVKPAKQSVYVEEFDAGELSGDWTVNNPNPDAYIVEDGSLLILANAPEANWRHDTTQNLFTFNQELPKGDWDIEMTFTGELATGTDLVWLGLRTDQDNLLASTFNTYSGCCNCNGGLLYTIKRAGGNETTFKANVRGSGSCDGLDSAPFAEWRKSFETNKTVITLHKRGRSYHTTMAIEGEVGKDGNPRVYATEPLTSLRSPGGLAFGIAKYSKKEGEVLVMIDKIEIFEVNE